MMTTLDEVRREPSKYWLGPVVFFHEIGEYTFVEYEEKYFQPHEKAGQLTGEHHFSIYINGKSIGLLASSLDRAMVTAIAYKYDGVNSQAAGFFILMIGAEIGDVQLKGKR